MHLQNIVVLASIVAIYALWYWSATRQERNKRRQAENLNAQRRALGIRPGFGATVRAFPKRCPRGVCTNPGASCPRECVEDPQVMRLIDGRVVHTYDNLEICFGPTGNVQEVRVGDRAWQ